MADTKDPSDAEIESAARAIEKFRTAVYEWTDEQFEIWWIKDPRCNRDKVRAWAKCALLGGSAAAPAASKASGTDCNSCGGTGCAGINGGCTDCLGTGIDPSSCAYPNCTCDPDSWEAPACARRAAPAAPASPEARKIPPEVAFAKGWYAASSWADRGDLMCDIGSPAYVKERDRLLSVAMDAPKEPTP